MAAPTKTIPILTRIFREKRWKELFDDLGIEDAFDSFVEVFKRLDDDEAELLFTVLEDYLFVDANSMLRRFRMIFKDIGAELLLGYYDSIIFVPLKQSNSPKTKSHGFALYPAFHALRNLSQKSSRVESYDTLDALSSQKKGRTNSLIFLVDDFIGTGDTALKAYTRFEKEHKVDTDDPVILSVVCLEIGKENIEKNGCQIWSSVEQAKGITNSTRIADKGKAIATMKGISSKLRIRPDYYLGYKASEGLISMSVRTPNNTFPLFWCPKDSSGEEWPAPFYR